ncbi:MAG: NAD-dependent epimerase/dehydratase family protein [Geobacteraceae bacterium]|nr:NAD-dependent epimerase/dehydratase family protein [Geobacteraceae bacterium]
MRSHLTDLIRRDCEEICPSAVTLLQEIKNQKLYITGGTGFVGTWIAELVTCLNDKHGFNTGLVLVARDTDSFRERAPHIASRKDIQLVSADVRRTLEIPDDVSYLLHLAASPDNRQHVSNPIVTMETITGGTGNVLDSASKLASLKKILVASSGQVYGKQGNAKISENMPGTLNSNSITSVYPEAKRYAETLCCAYWSSCKLPVVIARPFSFIGPYQGLDKPWAINNFIRDALMDNPVRIIGNGMPVRSYMYPSDMALWFLRILTSGTAGLAYNVGSPSGISLKDVAEKVMQYFGAAADVIIKNMNDDFSAFVPDDTFCRESLNLSVTVPIDTALRRSLEWYRSLE